MSSQHIGPAIAPSTPPASSADDFDEITSVHPVPPELLHRGDQPRRGTLTALVGSRAGEALPLGEEFTTIGRLPQCDITLAEASASRIHARIGRMGRGYFIEDLGSTNGTYLDGVRLTRPTLLDEGSLIVIGAASVFRFARLDPMAEAVSRRVYEATFRDPLTGLYNRRYLDERLTEEFANAVRNDTPLCVMGIDIDHFKSVNDRYGHAAGDTALCAVAETVRSAVRSDDVVARVGGEEFVLLARHIPPHAALALAERLRTAVATQRIRLDQETISVTVSIGVAHSDSELILSRPEVMLQAADDALYRAKRSGRNCVCTGGQDGASGAERRPLKRPPRAAAQTTIDLQAEFRRRKP